MGESSCCTSSSCFVHTHTQREGGWNLVALLASLLMNKLESLLASLLMNKLEVLGHRILKIEKSKEGLRLVGVNHHCFLNSCPREFLDSFRL